MLELKFKTYQIGRPIYLNGKEPDKYEFNICKLNSDGKTHFVIGKFWWDYDEPCWRFESCGTRYLEYYTEGLNEWLLKVMELFEIEIRSEEGI